MNKASIFFSIELVLIVAFYCVYFCVILERINKEEEVYSHDYFLNVFDFSNLMKYKRICNENYEDLFWYKFEVAVITLFIIIAVAFI